MIAGLFWLMFMMAQGVAIWGTAYLLSQSFDGSSWVEKLACIGLSYAGWVIFTFWLFDFFGADVFLIPFVASVVALVPTSIAAVLWTGIAFVRGRADA